MDCFTVAPGFGNREVNDTAKLHRWTRRCWFAPRPKACIKIELAKVIGETQDLHLTTACGWIGKENDTTRGVPHGRYKLKSSPSVICIYFFAYEFNKLLPNILVILICVSTRYRYSGSRIPAVETKRKILNACVVRQRRLNHELFRTTGSTLPTVARRSRETCRSTTCFRRATSTTLRNSIVWRTKLLTGVGAVTAATRLVYAVSYETFTTIGRAVHGIIWLNRVRAISPGSYTRIGPELRKI